MREIKFRAWDKFHNKLINDLFFDKSISINEALTECDEFICLQYTGLRDKNGVEIYEGDIVKSRLGIGIIDYTESYFRIFRPYIFSSNLCNETSSIELESKNYVEVIGNIYENKELLNN